MSAGGDLGAGSGADINQIKTINAPSENGKKIPDIPVWQRSMIYKYFTFYELFSLKLLKLDKNIEQIFNRRVEGMKKNGIRVPEDCKTLMDAVALVGWTFGTGKYARWHTLRIPSVGSTIVVGKGEHEIDGDYLEIPSAMKIVGDPLVPRAKIVIMGGICFKEGIEGNCHLQRLTIRKAWSDGVDGRSSFTMEDVLVEECGDYGVWAQGTGVVVQCTDVEVCQCQLSGVVAENGASITLGGAKTTVHNNCKDGQVGEYGLTVSGASSTIQLVFPLTKEKVSLNNGGGGNWGAHYSGDINQIKNIDVPSENGETKSSLRYRLRL